MSRFQVYTLLIITNLVFLTCGPAVTAAQEQAIEADIVVYGGTASGVIAAVQAKKMGRSAIIVTPDKHLGGLTAGGLGWTDTGNKGVIGGLSRDFYHRIWKKYQDPSAWRWQKKSEYGNRGQGTPAIDGKNRTMWIFEPHVAEEVFEDYIKSPFTVISGLIDPAVSQRKEAAFRVSLRFRARTSNLCSRSEKDDRDIRDDRKRIDHEERDARSGWHGYRIARFGRTDR